MYFLGASALFRDGLNAIFAFGGVIAVTVYGMDAGTVLVFGVVINVVSAAGALAGGWLDDRIGPKAVVVGSLTSLVMVGFILLFASGTTMFWIFGLILGLFVGPAQASSRSYLSRLCRRPGGPAVRPVRDDRAGRLVHLAGPDRAVHGHRRGASRPAGDHPGAARGPGRAPAGAQAGARDGAAPAG